MSNDIGPNYWDYLNGSSGFLSVPSGDAHGVFMGMVSGSSFRGKASIPVVFEVTLCTGI